jgi:hypothetical protein
MKYLRHPKTLQEKRAACGSPIPVRAKRKAWSLPSNWDDKPIAVLSDKNWKITRKTQYRPVEL